MSTQLAYGTTTRVDIDPEWCKSCGIPYGLPEGFLKQRRKDHATWYCPNGHQWHYPQGKTNEQKLEEAAARETALRDQLSASIREGERMRATLMHDRSRIANGICPCCNKEFSNVAHHMETEHPDYAHDHTPTNAGPVFKCSCRRTFGSLRGLRIHQGRQRTAGWDEPDQDPYWAHLTVVS